MLMAMCAYLGVVHFFNWLQPLSRRHIGQTFVCFLIHNVGAGFELPIRNHYPLVKVCPGHQGIRRLSHRDVL